MKLLSVVGARPQFMKVSQFSAAASKISGFTHVVVHTGQHYSKMLSGIFFDELHIPAPDHNLGVGSGSRDFQISQIRLLLSSILSEESPDLVLVYGDTNSTLGAALAASDKAIPIAHVEAGLRSFDHCIPEEINRIETDRLSDFLFASEKSGMDNIKAEQLPGKAFLSGDLMIDSLKKKHKTGK